MRAFDSVLRAKLNDRMLLLIEARELVNQEHIQLYNLF